MTMNPRITHIVIKTIKLLPFLGLLQTLYKVLANISSVIQSTLVKADTLGASFGVRYSESP